MTCDCGQMAVAKGKCMTCYMRARRQGQTSEAAYEQAARVWGIADTDECVVWQGPRTRGGYGVMHAHGRTLLVHRIAALAGGMALMSDPVVMHSCDNPACVSIRHLRGATQAENVADCVAKGRTGKRVRAPDGTLWPSVRAAYQGMDIGIAEPTLYKWVQHGKNGWLYVTP